MARTISPLEPTEIKVKKNWCKACGICIALCPQQVLKADERGKVVVSYPEKCIGCGICETHCPDYAISVEVGSND
ncbi:4Fe-4S binding protein [Metallumcola ferriviriculae]|uniref:4Fe-4S binding protein n=1 Tax=Metallumcola ferriviriculae TaxID=3039180 RepID=A0AAU0USU3_9FIRM|nr:4Fe-4S binding protein [Desulfitibacteraceae bacterium MK1]